MNETKKTKTIINRPFPAWKQLLLNKLMGEHHDALIFDRHPDAARHTAIKFSLCLCVVAVLKGAKDADEEEERRKEEERLELLAKADTDKMTVQ